MNEELFRSKVTRFSLAHSMINNRGETWLGVHNDNHILCAPCIARAPMVRKSVVLFSDILQWFYKHFTIERSFFVSFGNREQTNFVPSESCIIIPVSNQVPRSAKSYSPVFLGLEKSLPVVE